MFFLHLHCPQACISFTLVWISALYHSWYYHFPCPQGNFEKALPVTKGLFKAFPASKGLWGLIPASQGTWCLLALINGQCDLISFGYSGSSTQFFIGPLETLGGESINFSYGWFLEQTFSAPQKWEHCQRLLTQVTDVLRQPVGKHAYRHLVLDFCIASLMVIFPCPSRSSEKALPASKGLCKGIPSLQGTLNANPSQPKDMAPPRFKKDFPTSPRH